MGIGSINNRLHPEDGNLLQHVDALLVSGQVTLDHQFRLRHEDGHWVWIQIRGELTQSRKQSPCT